MHQQNTNLDKKSNISNSLSYSSKFSDESQKKEVDATVENTYENIVKIKYPYGNKFYFDYLEDDSTNIKPFEAEQVLNANQNDTSPTGDGSDFSYNNSPKIA